MTDAFTLLVDLLDPQPLYEWSCLLPDCDGKPHEGRPYLHARAKQRVPEGHWTKWLLLCGRGYGKTRTGSEVFLERLLANPVDVQGRPTWWLIGSRTHSETVALMIEGVSSLKYAFERRGIPFNWNKQTGRITLPTGQIIVTQHAEGNPDFGRGGEWAGVWIDEIGTFKRIKDAWENALPFSMRAKLPGGLLPFMLLTTTPKAEYVEPFEVMKSLVSQASEDGRVRVTRGTTWENEANIPAEMLEEWRELYPEGSRARRQELDAELLDAVEGALWFEALINATRLHIDHSIPGDVLRNLVFIDPAVSNGPKADEAGIIVLTKAMQMEEAKKVPHIYIREDLSARCSTTEWAETAVKASHRWQADIGYEDNQGGDLIRDALKDAARRLGISCPRLIAVHAKESKGFRAAVVAPKYESGHVHHHGYFPLLEQEMCTWVPESTSKSPNRIDAMVHGVRMLLAPPKHAPVKLRRLS